MPVITVIIVLVIIGLVLWLINNFIPMAAPIKTILNLLVIILVIWWLLSLFGIVPPLYGIQLK